MDYEPLESKCQMLEAENEKLRSVLERIAKAMTCSQIRRDSGVGLDYQEYLEMAYENVIHAAKVSLEKKRGRK